MATKRTKDHFNTMDSPYETQPPAGSAEPDIIYGGVAQAADDEPRDPLGVLPDEAKPRNIGPSGGEGR